MFSRAILRIGGGVLVGILLYALVQFTALTVRSWDTQQRHQANQISGIIQCEKALGQAVSTHLDNEARQLAVLAALTEACAVLQARVKVLEERQAGQDIPDWKVEGILYTDNQ